METAHIRNFCIIAHIDHGKSTLADRLLEHTGTVDPRNMTAQYLDTMDLERERGITIKGKAVRMSHTHTDGQVYQLNLIDTPGHVDFGYEVSRALAACEGALLVVDAAQGAQAQTLANAYLALGHDLHIIPVINKIDLPAAEPERVADEMVQVFGFDREELVFCSAKDGTGIDELLAAVVERVPPPKLVEGAPLRALIFDSDYDSYKGVIAYVRVIDGVVKRGDRIRMLGGRTVTEAVEVGVFRPELSAVSELGAGQVGYVATGFKDVGESSVGDTVALDEHSDVDPLPGYEPQKLMVFAGLYPSDGESFEHLREALQKLQLNDAALSYEAESSPALGFGFRCGFLGPLHMEIVQERPGAGVRDGPHCDVAGGGVSGGYAKRRGDDYREPVDDAVAGELPGGAGAVAGDDGHHALSLCRDDDGPLHGQPRRIQENGVHRGGDAHRGRRQPDIRRPCADAIRSAAGGVAGGVLRPDQVALAGVRIAGLHVHRLPGRAAGEAGHHAEQQACRRAVLRRASGQRV